MLNIILTTAVVWVSRDVCADMGTSNLTTLAACDLSYTPLDKLTLGKL